MKKPIWEHLDELVEVLRWLGKYEVARTVGALSRFAKNRDIRDWEVLEASVLEASTAKYKEAEDEDATNPAM